MIKTRKIHKTFKSKPTLEGAGVHLHRGIETITYVLRGQVERGLRFLC